MNALVVIRRHPPQDGEDMNEVIGVFNADDEATALAVVARDQAEWKSATGLPVPEYVLTLATFYGPGAEWEGPC